MPMSAQEAHVGRPPDDSDSSIQGACSCREDPVPIEDALDNANEVTVGSILPIRTTGTALLLAPPPLVELLQPGADRTRCVKIRVR